MIKKRVRVHIFFNVFMVYLELLMLRFRSPVQTELAHRPQDVYHALSPQLLAKDGGGDEAAGSTNPSAANRDRDH